jgi:hypothetical protein
MLVPQVRLGTSGEDFNALRRLHDGLLRLARAKVRPRRRHA